MKNQITINLPLQIQNFRVSSGNNIQSNSQGITNKKAELMDLISKEEPVVLCIQEAMLSKETSLILKYYNRLFKEGHTNYGAHGGVATFIHKTIPT